MIQLSHVDHVCEVVLVLLVTVSLELTDFTELVRGEVRVGQQKPLVDVCGGTEG